MNKAIKLTKKVKQANPKLFAEKGDLSIYDIKILPTRIHKGY